MVLPKTSIQYVHDVICANTSFQSRQSSRAVPTMTALHWIAPDLHCTTLHYTSLQCAFDGRFVVSHVVGRRFGLHGRTYAQGFTGNDNGSHTVLRRAGNLVSVQLLATRFRARWWCRDTAIQQQAGKEPAIGNTAGRTL